MLESIIPQEFFIAPIELPSSNNGKVIFRNNAIFVSWDRKCSKFADNLAACRQLKSEQLGFYRPSNYDWQFQIKAAKRVVELFPTLEIDQEIKNIAEKQEDLPVVVVTQQPTKHGNITLINDIYFVEWGGAKYRSCTKEAFGQYLSSAKYIQADFGGRYDAGKKGWEFPRKAAAALIKAYAPDFFNYPDTLKSDAELYPIFEIEEETQEPDDLADQMEEICDDITSQVLPNGRTLFQHQKDGVKWMVGCRNRFNDGVRQRGCILADSMGLGKTVQSLIAAKVHQTIDPTTKVIILCRRSLLRNWKRECYMAGVKATISTSSAAGIPSKIEGNFVIIADEAHDFQNPESKRTEKFLETVNVSNCQGVYLLTGTPIKNGRPHNLMPLLQAINHGLVSSKVRINDYMWRYCGPKTIPTPRGMVTTFMGSTNLAELHEKCKNSILRRFLHDCIDLPEKIRTLKEVELTPSEENDYEAILTSLRAEYRRKLREGKIKSGGDKLVHLTQLRRAGSLAKVRSAIEMAEDVMEEGRSVIIFTCFKESASKIAEHFGTTAFTGERSIGERDKLCEDFQSGKTKIFVGVDKAGGVGLNLFAGSVVGLVDRPWTPGDAEQLEGRAHRIGQKKTVNSLWMQYGVVDDLVDNLLIEKKGNIEEVLQGKRETLSFTEADMASEVIQALGWED